MKNRRFILLALALVLTLIAVIPASAQTPQPPYRVLLPLVQRAPEVITLNASADAYVYERDPNANTGSDVYLFAGNDEDPESQMGVMRSFVRFDLPAIRAYQVQQAVLRLYYAGYADFENQWRTVFSSAAPTPWDEKTVTWANQPGRGMDVAGTTISTNDPFGYVEIDVTTVTSDWLRGSVSNYGLMIQGPESRGSNWAYRVFASRESAYPPQLVITLR